MPFYEYECADCKFYLEIMQKISEPPLKKCPSCGRSRMKKLVSAPNFRLKGGGWYETDFKSDQEKKRNLAKEPEAEPTAETKTEAKPVEAKASEPKAPEPNPADPKRKPPSRRITRTKSRPKPTAVARRRSRR